jgi:hypothetical protein
MECNPRLRHRKVARDRLSAGERPVDNANLGYARVGKSGDDRPSRTAGAENNRRACRRIPIRHCLAQVLAKSKGISISPFEAAVRPDDNRVYRANPTRQWFDAVDNGKSSLLVRNRQITASEPEHWQRPKRLLDMLRPNRQRDISSIYAGLIEPEAVQQRLSRMGHWPSHDPGEACRPIDFHHITNRDYRWLRAKGSPASQEANELEQRQPKN